MRKLIAFTTLIVIAVIAVIAGGDGTPNKLAGELGAVLRIRHAECYGAVESGEETTDQIGELLEAADWAELKQFVESGRVQVVFIGCSDLLDVVLNKTTIDTLRLYENGRQFSQPCQLPNSEMKSAGRTSESSEVGVTVMSVARAENDPVSQVVLINDGSEAGSNGTSTVSQTLLRIMGQRAEIVKKYAADSLVIREVEVANQRSVDMEQIMDMDAEWTSRAETEWIKGVLGSPVSHYLRRKVLSNSLIYTEAFLCDRRGSVIGVYPRTSDYWQGDEKKFTEAFNGGAGKVVFGPLEYDESSDSHSVQVSVPVNRNGHAIGVLIMGLRNLK